jgi:hypothetical protein
MMQLTFIADDPSSPTEIEAATVKLGVQPTTT